jgi:meso-butanediol dehydrogenase / (S,S)-butanediol dehydrogenase / diacetyl reductase
MGQGADVAGRLAGKTAVITGTGAGQGRAAAIRFAAAGAHVVGCDTNPDGAAETVELVRAAGHSMTSLHPLDLTNEDEVIRLTDTAVAAHGRLDILYNSAAATRGAAVVSELRRDDWNWTLDYDLTLMFLSVKHAVPVFRRQGGGVVINIASVAGINVSSPNTLAHSVAKAGVIRMTSFLAVELAPINVRVNCISPGPIDTPALRRAFGQPPEPAEADWSTFTDRSLLTRIGHADDIAMAALFLASDEASFITGVNLPVDGGASTGQRDGPVR